MTSSDAETDSKLNIIIILYCTSLQSGENNKQRIKYAGQHVVERRTVLETIARRNRNWIGHMIRGEVVLREMIEGRMVGEIGL